MHIANIISCRRMIFLQTILKRPKTEMTRRIYDPRPDDWCEMVRKDFDQVDLSLDEQTISAMTELQYKKVDQRKNPPICFQGIEGFTENL